MATKSARLAPIEPQLLYPRELLAQAAGIGISTLRQAAHRGELRQRFVSSRCYILGSDFIAYVQQHGKQQKDN